MKKNMTEIRLSSENTAINSERVRYPHFLSRSLCFHLWAARVEIRSFAAMSAMVMSFGIGCLLSLV